MGHVFVPLVGAEVGLPLLRAKARGQALVLTRAAISQVAALFDVGGLFIAVNRDVEFFAEGGKATLLSAAKYDIIPKKNS